MADRREVDSEVQRVCALRGIEYRPSVLDRSYALTAHERGYIKNYRSKWKERGFAHVHGPDVANPWVCYNLGDAGTERITWSAVSQRLPTYLRSFRPYWFPSAKRWMTPRERLATMGFCTYASLADQVGCAPLYLDDAACKDLAGNAMHLANVGVLASVCLACVRICDV